MTYLNTAPFQPDPTAAIEEQMPETVFAMGLAGEARGRPIHEKVGVAFVMRNRALQPTRFGADPHDELVERIKSVLLKRYQFSAFNASDPNHAKLLGFSTTEPKAWRECVAVCCCILDGMLTDPTAGATHYESFSDEDIQGGKAPKWASPEALVARIGAFHFYRVA